MVLWFDGVLCSFKISADKSVFFADSQKIILNYLLDNSASASIILVNFFLFFLIDSIFLPYYSAAETDGRMFYFYVIIPLLSLNVL